MDYVVLDSILLPIKLTNANEGQSKSWYKAANTRKKYERLLRFLHYRRKANAIKPKPYPFPVVVRVTRILGAGERLWDSSSILRGSYKQLEDTLVCLNWFQDDSPRWIRQTIALQDATQRNKGPAVLIEILREE